LAGLNHGQAGFNASRAGPCLGRFANIGGGNRKIMRIALENRGNIHPAPATKPTTAPTAMATTASAGRRLSPTRQ
jgi:hypothetical protein